MFRKFLLLLLFVTFIGFVLRLQTAESTGSNLLAWSGRADPSHKPLPKAWSNAGRAEVRLVSQTAAPATAAAAVPAADAGSTVCPATVSVQRGDTLGAIAKRCAVSLADLLAVNPTVTNPNRIYPGQELLVHGARGGADPAAVTAQPPAGGFAPGAGVTVTAEGFAPNAQVKIGIGLPQSAFRQLGVYPADAAGRLTVTLTIPSTARSGERAFFLLSSSGVPTTQVVSEAFVISE